MDFASVGISLLKVVVVGLALGAGLPAIFALGLRLSTRTANPVPSVFAQAAFTASPSAEQGSSALALGDGSSATEPATGVDAPGYVTRLDRAMGAACFAIVALAVVAGIVWIVVNG